mmetsp:Transcript_76780/g.150547  ORF Transcript_76780/g.150547 Transcript_76780/m.150547 type:complete len:208 (-) Transcript_76780:41-664(-)
MNVALVCILPVSSYRSELEANVRPVSMSLMSMVLVPRSSSATRLRSRDMARQIRPRSSSMLTPWTLLRSAWCDSAPGVEPWPKSNHVQERATSDELLPRAHTATRLSEAMAMVHCKHGNRHAGCRGLPVSPSHALAQCVWLLRWCVCTNTCRPSSEIATFSTHDSNCGSPSARSNAPEDAFHTRTTPAVPKVTNLLPSGKISAPCNS